MREAANASQLRRNFLDSPLLAVPEVYWDWCTHRGHGDGAHARHPGISRSMRSARAGHRHQVLARAGVEIFFTQVFRDGFFHADMHPGNILVGQDGRYIALDFGIMGTLTDFDKNYLAQNFLAFFRRDYRRVAQAHSNPAGRRKDTAVDRVRIGDPRRVRTDLRQAAEGDLVREGAAAALPDLAPLQYRDPAAARAACRKRCSTSRASDASSIPTSTCGRPRKPFLERWMSRTDRLARARARGRGRGAALGHAAAAISPTAA